MSSKTSHLAEAVDVEEFKQTSKQRLQVCKDNIRDLIKQMDDINVRMQAMIKASKKKL